MRMYPGDLPLKCLNDDDLILAIRDNKQRGIT